MAQPPETHDTAPGHSALDGGTKGLAQPLRTKGPVWRLLIALRQIKLARFATVGVANSLLYAVITALSISIFHLPDQFSSLVGYLSVVPFAFLAHRHYTFNASGKVRHELPRFLITHATGLLVSVLVMGFAVNQLGLHYVFGILGVMVLVPIVSYLILDRWVFPRAIDDSPESP